MLTTSAPDFEPDLELNAARRTVTYQGQSFRVRPSAFSLLQLLIEAPSEVVTMDQLVTSLWGDDEPEVAEANVKFIVWILRGYFKIIDPAFDKIRVKTGVGFYWKREFHQKTSRGRVAVADHVFEGYADGRLIELEPAQHAILEALLRRAMVTRATVDAVTTRAFQANASRLNRKFQDVLGFKLIERGPHGSGAYRLNKAVYE